MTQFWFGVAGSILLLACILLWPRRRLPGDVDREATNVALYRQRRAELEQDRQDGKLTEAEYAALVDELGAGLVRDAAPVTTDAGTPITTNPAAPAHERRLRFALLALLPVVALGIYWKLGRFEDVDLAGVANQLEAAEASGSTEGHAPAQLAAMADKLERRLSDHPDDADGWFLLGRTALSLQEYKRAATAFAHVSAIVPNEPAPVIYQAQAEFMAANRAITPPVKAAIDKALALAPDHPVMMEMLGVEAFQRGDFKAAMDFLMRGLPGVTDPQQRTFFQEGITRAATQLGVPVPDLAAAAPQPPPGMTPPGMAAAGAAPATADAAAPGSRFIDVDVQLKPGLSLPPTAAVFVTAKAVGGPPMPLAVQRLTVADLPTKVRLDERTAMNPMMSIATAERVYVSARVSRSGTAMRSGDDVEVVSGPITLTGGAAIDMVIGGSASAPRTVDGGAAPMPRATTAERADPAAASGPMAAPMAAGPSGSQSMAPSGTVVRVMVQLGPQVQATPQTAVFVFARQVNGPPMPVAVRRLTVADLPAIVTLDDTTAMQPGRNLSSVPSVELVARLSRSGTVMPGPGDVEGRAGPVQPKAVKQVLSILVDQVRQ